MIIRAQKELESQLKKESAQKHRIRIVQAKALDAQISKTSQSMDFLAQLGGSSPSPFGKKRFLEPVSETKAKMLAEVKMELNKQVQNKQDRIRLIKREALDDRKQA